MMRIGITGGIGAGKSYVSQLLQTLGVRVYDCDAQAKRLMNESPELRQRLKALVGEGVYDEHGLVRPVLADYLFASPEHAAKVNAIVHPVVRADFRHWTSIQDAMAVAMESAILYESGFDAEVDCVLFVDAPQELRIARAMRRDGTTRSQVERRIAMQHTDEYKSRATWVCHNDGSADLLCQLKEIIQEGSLSF